MKSLSIAYLKTEIYFTFIEKVFIQGDLSLILSNFIIDLLLPLSDEMV